MRCKAITANVSHWKAADYLVENFIRDSQVIALGSGPLAAAVTEVLGEAVSSKLRQGIRCIGASDAAAVEAAVHGIPQTDLQSHPQVDILCCDVDCLDATNMAFTFGCQDADNMQHQPQLLRFARLAAAAQQIIALVDDPGKIKPRLGGSLPVAIKAEGWEATAEELDDMFLGDAEIWRRSSMGTADPRGGVHPYTSPEGHQIVDIKFYGTLKLFGKEVPYRELAVEIEKVRGVVTHGLMTKVAHCAIVPGKSGPKVRLPGSLRS